MIQTTIITSVLSLCIYLATAKISTENIRLELYKKRFNIFSTVVSYCLIYLNKNHEKLNNIDAEEKFILALHESVFLFKSSSNIFETIKKIQKTVSLLKSYDDQSNPKAKGNKTNAEIADVRGSLEGDLNALKTSMMPYLNFSTLSWWIIRYSA